jgi:hypothetical protein
VNVMNLTRPRVGPHPVGWGGFFDWVRSCVS